MRFRLTSITLLLVSTLITVRPLHARHDPATVEQNERPPNILLIISDDQRFDTMGYMPRTQAGIFDQGIAFTHAYVTTPRCCPSRASILTGMYARHHGVHLNTDSLHETTIVQRLHEAGYYTGVVGKYLNSYPYDDNDGPLPEFDYWVTYISGLFSASYFDTRLNVNGEWVEHSGYQTYLLRDYALDFLDQAAAQEQPFFLIFSPYAPHRPAYPPREDRDLYTDLEPYRPPGFNEWDMSDKPVWLQAKLPPLTIQQIRDIDDLRKRQLQSLNALDITVEDLLERLEKQGELERTVVIYLSDNGLMWGEHRFDGAKVFVYEPSIHVPFAIRYPPLINQRRVEERLVANIDIAPTLYDLAGLPIPTEVDGRSLVPLIDDPAIEWRDHLFIEARPEQVSGLGEGLQDGPPYIAIHTGQYVYVESDGDRAEFYDLEADLYQLQNQIENPKYAGVIADLDARMEAERLGYPAPTRIAGVPLATRARHTWKWLTANAVTLYITYRYSPKLYVLIGVVTTSVIAVAFRRRIMATIQRKQ